MMVRTAGRSDFAGLQALMTMLRVETEAMRPGANAVIAQLSSALFALVIRAWLEQAGTMPGLFAVLAERRLQAALQAMLAAPEKPWSLQDMAAACHMSRATFARLFRSVAGTTPATMLMQTRMAQAALWLAQGKRSVGDIGEAVGYQSEAAFNRVFKRCFGVGPGQYRRSARINHDAICS
ncbi:AraC family transcriptional regulator [Glaciimonas sp. CA11.2]|nr:AraC family transcriptional regulator [Glaciimonas sp. CA11.2]